MSIPISGILLDPYGNIARFADIKMVTLVGSSDVIETSNSTFRTDENGAYSIDVQFGRFAVYMRFNGSNGSYTKIQAITVNSDTIASTLGELLAYTEPLTPDEILIVQALVNEAIAAKDLAQAAALQAGIDADSAAVSETNAELSAVAAANSVALLAPVPLNGGVWASGQIFTAYNQYMIFGGEAYSARQETPLPYTAGASPDLGFVYQVKLNSLQSLSGLTEPSDLAQRHRIETTVAEIATGVFNVGDRLSITDLALAPFNVVSGGADNGVTILGAGAGKTAEKVYTGAIKGNLDKEHFSIGAIPKINTSTGVAELITGDGVHNTMNVASVSQPDQFIIRLDYSKVASRINSLVVAPDAELVPYGLMCGGDVGTALANIHMYAPLKFLADNNSPNPSLAINTLWASSVATGAITATRLNSSTLRVTHPPITDNEPPVVSAVNTINPYNYVVSFGATQVDVICVGSAKGYVSYSGSAWSQAFSDNATAPTITWTGASLKVDHGVAYSGRVVPTISAHGSGLIPRVSNYGGTFFEVSFYDFTGALVTTQAATMQFWYSLSLQVPCLWPTGDLVSVHRGICRVPSYTLKGVAGNNLWVTGDFEM